MPKEISGVGILDLNVMNMVLLLKWLWKLKQPQYHNIWKQLVQIKYKKHTSSQGKSPVWRDIHRGLLCNFLDS
jgi:hypothetical protein